MSPLARALRWLWEFVVGDDPFVTAGVALTIATTALVAALGLPAWWLMPLGTLCVLGLSLRRGN